jgi:hypothetical protein
MSIVSRSLAALLLLAALGVGVHGLVGPRARADGPEFTRLCGPDVSPLGSNIQWDPAAYERLLKDFVVEATRYSPEDHRFTWTLRTRRSFPGALGKAETELAKVLQALIEDGLFGAYFYDAEGRKVGFGELFILPGERRPDNTFVVFADLNLYNADLIATRAVITQIGLPKLYGGKLEFKVEPTTVELAPGGKAKLKVTVTKGRDLYLKAIAVEIKKLPPGVTAEKATIPELGSSVEVELSAAADAEEVTQKGVRVEGTATELRTLQGTSPPFTVSVTKKK